MEWSNTLAWKVRGPTGPAGSNPVLSAKEKTMHWVIQENVAGEAGYHNMIGFLKRSGIPMTLVKVIPFVGELSPQPSIEGNVICIGSYSMRKHAKDNHWWPGVFDIEKYDYTYCNRHWGENMLNFDSMFCKFADVIPPVYDFFIRPIHDSKNFAGRLETKETFLPWQHNVVALGNTSFDTLDGNTEVMLSPIKKIFAEWRFWIVNGKISTCSQYKRGNRVTYEHGAPEYVHDYVNAMLDKHCLDMPFVMDVCDTATKGMRIVELNTLNASGFYAGDMQKLVVSLEEAFG